MTGTRIPAVIHQYWDGSMSKNNKKWISLNPGYVYLMWSDDDIIAFFTAYYPQHVKAFERIPSQVMKQRVCRYLVLSKFGGVFADSHTQPEKPLCEWIRLVKEKDIIPTYYGVEDLSFITGIQKVNPDSDILEGNVAFSPSLIASSPGHVILDQMIFRIWNGLENIVTISEQLGSEEWTSTIFASWKLMNLNVPSIRDFDKFKSLFIHDQLFLSTNFIISKDFTDAYSKLYKSTCNNCLVMTLRS